jgi:hypothetical protein
LGTPGGGVVLKRPVASSRNAGFLWDLDALTLGGVVIHARRAPGREPDKIPAGANSAVGGIPPPVECWWNDVQMRQRVAHSPEEKGGGMAESKINCH